MDKLYIAVACLLAGFIVSYLGHAREQKALATSEAFARELAHKAEVDKEKATGELKALAASIETRVKGAELAVKNLALQGAHEARVAGKDAEAFFSHILKSIGLLK